MRRSTFKLLTSPPRHTVYVYCEFLSITQKILPIVWVRLQCDLRTTMAPLAHIISPIYHPCYHRVKVLRIVTISANVCLFGEGNRKGRDNVFKVFVNILEFTKIRVEHPRGDFIVHRCLVLIVFFFF